MEAITGELQSKTQLIFPYQISCVIKNENPASITLVRVNVETETVLRTQIREMRTAGLSLMPEGLEKELRPSDLADLIAYLQQHRR